MTMTENEIETKEWYDSMFSKVKGLLNVLVQIEAEFVGYINTKVSNTEVTISWTSRTVTVTADKEFKWEMPLKWFVSDEMASRVTTPSPVKAAATQPQPQPQSVPSGDQDEDDGITDLSGESMLGGISHSAFPGVKSVDEILAEQGLEDAGD
jgi:hypothetical protein